MKKHISTLLLVTLIGILLAGCTTEQTETPVSESNLQAPGLIAEGRLVPVNFIDHIFTVSGQVENVPVQDGEAVTKGQVLAAVAVSPEALAARARAEQEVVLARQAMDELTRNADVLLAASRLRANTLTEAVEDAQARYDDDSSEKNQIMLDSALAELEIAQDDLFRLEDGKGVDPDQLEAAQARLDSAQASLENAQAWINAFQLTAAMDGTVIDLGLQAGEVVAAGTPVITIADFSGWLVKTDNLTELEVAQIAVGQPVEITLDAIPDVVLDGVVSSINQRFEEKRGDITYTVVITLTKTDPLMRWGMTAAVRFLD